MELNAHDIATELQGYLAQNLFRGGYTHPPIQSGSQSYFTSTINGRRFCFTVEEISTAQELAEALKK